MHLPAVWVQPSAGNQRADNQPNSTPHPSCTPVNDAHPLLWACYTFEMRTFGQTFATVLVLTTLAHGEAPVDVELVAPRGLQVTAPQAWLQLLSKMQLGQVRIRSTSRPGGSRLEPSIKNRGTEQHPRYHVLGLLTADGKLVLPGGTFKRNDHGKLNDYFQRLAADGPEGVTAPRGNFGLTERQFHTVHDALATKVRFPTHGKTVQQFVDQLANELSLPLVPDQDAHRVLRSAEPVTNEVEGLSAGTALAVLLGNCGLALRPEKPRGQNPRLQIVRAQQDLEVWPVGWKPQERPRELAPVLFEFLNVEISGYSLAEALAAVGPRLGMPLLIDRSTLERHNIDPTQIKIELPHTRTYYKRVLDRILSQARLKGELKADEAGNVFYWVTR